MKETYALYTLCSFLFLLLAVPNTATPGDNGDFYRNSCKVTRYPDLCYTALSPSGSAVNDKALLSRLAIYISLSKATNVTSILKQDNKQQPTKPKSVCVSNFRDAVEMTRESLEEVKKGEGSTGGAFRWMKSNVQTWMSAAITNQDTCTDTLSESGATLRQDISQQVDDSKKLTTIALAIFTDYANGVPEQ